MNIETTLMGKKVSFLEADVSKTGNIVSSPFINKEGDVCFIIKTDSGKLKAMPLQFLQVITESNAFTISTSHRRI